MTDDEKSSAISNQVRVINAHSPRTSRPGLRIIRDQPDYLAFLLLGISRLQITVQKLKQICTQVMYTDTETWLLHSCSMYTIEARDNAQMQAIDALYPL
jgi:hypothetical protein